MYENRPLVGGVALLVLAAVLIGYSLSGSWIAWEGEQILKWMAGAAGIALGVWAKSLFDMAGARKRWAARSGEQ